MSHYDVVIIGSGISSLTAAALLSQHGRSVLVLERYQKVGGYMHCFHRQGHRFDTGAHYVGAMEPGQSFWALLNYIGVYDSKVFIPLDPTGFDQFYFPQFSISLPKGYREVIERLTEKFPSEKSAIQKYFSLTQEAVQHFPTYTYSDKPEIEMSLRFLKLSLATVVEELTDNKDLQSVLFAYCSLHGVAPQEVAFGLHALMVDSLITGPYGFAQGGEALVDQFVKKIEQHGGKVLTRKKVTELKVVNRSIQSVVTEDGDSFSADWVISGIHPKATVSLIREEVFSKAFIERLQNIKESIGIFGLYTVLKNSTNINPLRNYYYFEKNEPAHFFDPQDKLGTPGLVFASPAHRSHTGGLDPFPMNFHAASPIAWFNEWQSSRIGHRPTEYLKLKEQISERMLELAGRYISGLQENIGYKQMSSPLSNLFFNGSEEGSAFGIYHSIDNTGVRALGPRTKVLNLLLTGQSTLFPGLMASATAGLRTSAHLLGMKPLVREIKKYFQPEAHL